MLLASKFRYYQIVSTTNNFLKNQIIGYYLLLVSCNRYNPNIRLDISISIFIGSFL